MNVLFYMPKDILEGCFSAKTLEQIKRLTNVMINSTTDEIENNQNLSNIHILITGWGTPKLTSSLLDKMQNLELLIHSAGSIKELIPSDFWRRKIRVATCNNALAIGVAETNLGLMLITSKRLLEAMKYTREGKWFEFHTDYRNKLREFYGIKIGIIGASTVGRHLIKLLKMFDVEIIVYDPYLSEEDAKNMGVKKVNNLLDIAKECDFVNLCAPTTEETKGMITGEFFRTMKENSVFINTSRGIIVKEKEMIEELKKGRIIACIDVTYPEPPEIENELRKLPNVILTPHIAGHVGNARQRQGDFVLRELESYVKNKTLINEITEKRFKIMA